MLEIIGYFAAGGSVVYLGIGVLVAGYEKMQTDNKFDFKLMLKWPWRIFG